MNTLILLPNDFKKSREIFLSHKEKVEALLQDYDTTIEHVGSTAIPGTIGKGIIDIVVTCQDKSVQFAIIETLTTGGYRQGELQKPYDGRLFFCSVEGKSQAGDVHLHLVIQNSTNHLEVTQFRDYLLGNPELVESYNEEKQRLAKLTDNDRSQYVVLKGPFIKKMLDKSHQI
jgi:GrpB-like predicted nucleotidyltransferase (UPF0157 family)